MGKKSAEQNILDYLKEQTAPVSGSALQRMLFTNRNGTYASPKTIARRLAENAEQKDGCPPPLLVPSYDDKGHVFYAYDKKQLPKKQVVTQLPNGNVKVEYI